MKKLISLALALVLLALSLVSCDIGNDPAPDTTDATEATDATTTLEDTDNSSTVDSDPEPEGLKLMENKVANFTIIRPENTTQAQIDTAVNLNRAIKELTGSMLTIKTDYKKKDETLDASAHEILIGDTNRPETTELKAQLEGNRFAIRTTSTKIVIVAATDTLLEAALNHFIDTYLVAGNADISEGNLTLNARINYLSKNINPLYDLLTQSKTFSSSCSKLYNIARPSETIKTVQGGCSDGTYYYQAFIQKDSASNEVENVVRIVKVDLETGKRIQVSGDLDLNHSNDITYNSKTKQLVVCHNNPYRTKLSIIDPETLEFVKSVEIDVKIYSIEYNAKRDMYVVGLSNGQTFRFLDADFKLYDNIVHEPTPQTKGYTTQGVACDDDLIYFVLYKQNVITVYDWEGDFVSLIELDVGNVEPENLSIVNGEIYVSSTGGGATVWKVVPQIKQ